MARPLKNGMGYFPKDTDFYYDDKVRLIRAEFGAKGMYLLDYLLCELYRKDGYYMKWDSDRCALVSQDAGCGCSADFVGSFVKGCLRRSFFDQRIFEVFGVLTSVGIQRRFVRMLNQRERITFIEEYFLLDKDNSIDVPKGILNKLAFKKITINGNPVKTNGNPFKTNDNAQSKEKERRGDKSISKERREAFKAVSSAYLASISDNPGDPFLKELNMWLDKVDSCIILYAIDQAVKYDRPNASYIRTILNSKYKAGITHGEKLKETLSSRYIERKPRKNAFQDYGSGGYDEDFAIMQMQMAGESGI